MTPPEPAASNASRLPVIDGLPAIEYIETTDDDTGRNYTVHCVDGQAVAFKVLRLDMRHLSTLMVTMRIRQAYAAQQPAPGTHAAAPTNAMEGGHSTTIDTKGDH